MNAIQIADSFDLYAIDHTPGGWPAVHQKQLTEAALMLRKQQEAIVKLRKALEYLLADNNDEYILSRLWDNARTALADTEEFVK